MRRKLILASGSPRRRELLLRFGIPFDVISSSVEEIPLPGEDPEAFARRAAWDKCRDVAQQVTTGVVIGADTVVTMDKEILGKPENPEDACRMLETLSGRWHEVITGVAVMDGSEAGGAGAAVTTRVKFMTLDPRTIHAYVETGEPLDKAGAYGIQGLGGILIERIEGCYYNVVGLPLNALGKILKNFGVNLV